MPEGVRRDPPRTCVEDWNRQGTGKGAGPTPDKNVQAAEMVERIIAGVFRVLYS